MLLHFSVWSLVPLLLLSSVNKPWSPIIDLPWDILKTSIKSCLFLLSFNVTLFREGCFPFPSLPFLSFPLLHSLFPFLGALVPKWSKRTRLVFKTKWSHGHREFPFRKPKSPRKRKKSQKLSLAKMLHSAIYRAYIYIPTQQVLIWATSLLAVTTMVKSFHDTLLVSILDILTIDFWPSL